MLGGQMLSIICSVACRRAVPIPKCPQSTDEEGLLWNIYVVARYVESITVSWAMIFLLW